MMRINDIDVDNTLEMVDVDNAGGPVYYYKGNPFNGIIESFYDNGKLMDEAEFTDGHIGGVQREYYENGQMKSEYYEYFGKPEGNWKDWDENGTLINHSIWKEGERIEQVVGKY